MRNRNSANSSAMGDTSKRDKQRRRQEQQALQREKEIARQSTRRRRIAMRIGAGILAIAAVAAAIAYSLRGSASTGTGVAVAASLGPPTANVASPPIGQFSYVGKPLYQGGKPEVLFIGAQYCPHCAGQRWPLVKALERFGSFSGLTKSTNDDGTIPTFDLHNATYSSNYVSLVARDVEDRNHHPLDTLTADEQSLFNQYDRSGGIPLVLVGGYSVIGDGYNLADIAGLPFGAVQHALQRNSSQVYVPEINAEANSITAFICHTDGMKPASACGRPVIKQIVSKLR